MAELNGQVKNDYSMSRYMMALIEILDDKADKRSVKKIKKLKAREGEVFLKNWRTLYCARKDKMKHLDCTDVKGCNQVIEILYQEFRHLGIRIP